MKKQTKMKKVLLTIATLAIALTAQITFAAYDDSFTYSTCSLGIYPYNPIGTSVNELNKQWFNLFPGPDKNCTNHLVYSDQYTPNPPLTKDNPLVNTKGVENIKAENARHNHIYHNATKEDNYYYKTWIDRFEITLKEDTLNNTDKANVVCYTPKEGEGEIVTPGCNGKVNEWGGTDISYNQSTGVITWKFAVDNGKGRPAVWGNNPSLKTKNGLFPASVKLISKNNPQEIWSATTTSRILIRDQAILKGTAEKAKILNKKGINACANDATSNSTYDYKGTWCTLPSPNIKGVLGNLNDASTGNKTYYWFRIGIVGTVWENPTPKAAAACESITISPTELNKSGKTNLTATVNFNDNKQYKTTVAWTAANGNVNPQSEEQTNNTFDSIFTISNPKANASVTAKVTAVDGAKLKGTKCAAGLTITTESQNDNKTCSSLTILRDGSNFSGTHQTEATISKLNVKVDATTAYANTLKYNWTVSGGGTMTTPQTTQPSTTTTLTGGTNGTKVTVKATDPNDTNADLSKCVDSFELKDKDEKKPEQPEQPTKETFKNPTLEKLASSKSKEGPFVKGLLTVPPSPQGKKVYYELDFEADPEKLTSAEISDTIGLGQITATLLPQGGIDPGKIKYNNDMEVLEGNKQLKTCDEIQKTLKEDEVAAHCFSGNIGSGNLSLTKISGKVRILYSGTVQSALTNAVCSDNTKEVCQEKYNNSAHAKNIKVFVGDEEHSVRPITSNAINLQIFCQYILTRAAGDIFLETDLSAGVDINKCSKFQSTTGIIITPGDEETPGLASTGQGTKIFTVGHEVCTEGQSGTIKDNALSKLYGSEITGLSSQICEVKLRTGNPWKQSIIVSGIDENKTRASRWGAEFGGTGTTVNLSSILFTSPDQNVFHISGDARTGAINVNEIGAKTFIIEDGDLYINENIHYTGTCPKNPPQTCNVRDIASLAFIVLNGNIYVDKDVTEMSGVFFVQEGSKGTTGRLFSNDGSSKNESASYNKLTIYGSIYGDIDPLFNKRFYAGDPAQDQGGIVIRFDQRVILNTPPALRDVLNLSQTQVAR